VGLEHLTYLLNILKKFYGSQYNMAGDKIAGMDIEWSYASCCCCISMLGYISSLFLKYIRSAKQDDNYEASNIILPCPGI
jgi:hypothetical protein